MEVALAVGTHRIPVLTALFQNCSVANGVGQTALHVACLWGNVEAAQALVTAKADLNAQNNFSGASPLHCAATENSRYAHEYVTI